MTGVGLTKHISVDGPLETEDEWYYAECKCGFSSPPVPDLETLMDEMMMHVSSAVQSEYRGVDSE